MRKIWKVSRKILPEWEKKSHNLHNVHKTIFIKGTTERRSIRIAIRICKTECAYGREVLCRNVKNS